MFVAPRGAKQCNRTFYQAERAGRKAGPFAIYRTEVTPCSLMEIGRRMAQLGQKEDAQKAYTVALAKEELSPMERFEAASYIFFFPGQLQNGLHCPGGPVQRGHFRQDIMHLLAQAFYQPNEEELRQRYAANCAALAAYPYCFRRDFPGF